MFRLLFFSELCLTGYTVPICFSADIAGCRPPGFAQSGEASRGLDIICAVGLPLASGSSLYNVAAVFQNGRLLAFVPKYQIPNYSEFYEARHFSPGPADGVLSFGGEEIPFGRNLLFCAVSSLICVSPLRSARISGLRIHRQLIMPQPARLSF